MSEPGEEMGKVDSEKRLKLNFHKIHITKGQKYRGLGHINKFLPVTQ